MSTIHRGNQAEAKVLEAFVDRNLLVAMPFGGGHPYDVLVDVGSAVLRVQCKCSRLYRGCIVFNSSATDHGCGQRDYRGLADVFGVWFPPADKVFVVPVYIAATSRTRLRLTSTRNNQTLRVHMAADYAIDRWTPERLAALAA